MPVPNYTRTLVREGDRLLIQSVCDLCGHTIVDSVTDTLLERERDHRAKCTATVLGVAV
ncbi:MAG TPA: hypothetical protein VKW78_13075 [Terriglobales bacterium]|nr:hypothetical protein [Terriglobales bacterium]